MSDAQGLLGGDDLVTGEAVALDLPPATVGVRVVSGLIDLLCEAALLLLAYLVSLVAVSSSDAALVAVVSVVVSVGVLVAAPTAMETVTRGKTPGKYALGLRTVRDDAGPIAFRQAFVRALVGFVEIWLTSGVAALLCSLVSARGQRLGDLAAGTYVVRERFPAPQARPAVMPHRLAGWAGSADLAPLPDGLALATRQFLARAATLNPASRVALGAQLTARVLPLVAPPPPPGHHPEEVLAAVLAERRRRDEARLAREDALRERLTRTRPRPGGTSGR